MKTRIISGAIFVIIICGFFALREIFNPATFYVLTTFISIVGTFEILRAYGDRLCKILKIILTLISVFIVPAFAVLDYYFSYLAVLMVISFVLLIIIAEMIISLIKNGEINFFNLIPIFYPTIPVIVMSGMNALKSFAFIALLLTFVISPLTDTFAYFVGMAYNKIKKGTAKKLCPNLSPKKTVAGAIGGLLGGILGGLLVCIIFKVELYMNNTLLIFLALGIIASILTQIGDLFESFIKRRVGIKDMGKIMPGHGGVLDRFDGIFFNGIFTYIFFLLI